MNKKRIESGGGANDGAATIFKNSITADFKF
jgi:hypothetical protein